MSDREHRMGETHALAARTLHRSRSSTHLAIIKSIVRDESSHTKKVNTTMNFKSRGWFSCTQRCSMDKKAFKTRKSDVYFYVIFNWEQQKTLLKLA